MPTHYIHSLPTILCGLLWGEKNKKNKPKQQTNKKNLPTKKTNKKQQPTTQKNVESEVPRG